MKKLLTILSVISLTSAATTSVVACGSDSSNCQKNLINLTKKIPDFLVIGQLNNNSVKGFLSKFQTALASLDGLTIITTNDYDVYKAGTTTAIQDSDITNSNHIFVDINSKNHKFIGAVKNIGINYVQNENNVNSFEVAYRGVAHNWIKTKISRDIFLDIKNDLKKNNKEFKNISFKLISNFLQIDNTAWGGSILQSDYDTFVNVIVEHFQEINSFFEKLPENQGLLIVTNRIGSWDKNDYMGVFSQSSSNKIDNSNNIVAASITTGAGTTTLTTTELAKAATALSAQATGLATTAAATATLATKVVLTTADVATLTADAASLATAIEAVTAGGAKALATTGTIATAIDSFAATAAGAAAEAAAATATVATEATGLATAATALSAQATALATTGTILAVGAVVLGAVLIIGAASFAVWYFW